MHINVKARTSSFDRKMLGVRQTIRKLAVGFINIAKKAALFGAAIGAIAVGAIVLLTKKGLATVDTLAKLAANVGTTVASLQILQHMATLGGVSIEKMDKSVAKMVKNIGESAMGIGTATDALKELNLKATDLEKMAPEKMFGVLADEINKLPTAARRASVAYDIFGRAGQELLVTMSGGSAAVSEMTEKMTVLGVLVGQDQARMVEQANDAWADIGLVWKGLSQQLAVNFAPVLIEIANRIKTMVIEFGGMAQVAEFIVRSFFMAGAGIMDMINMISIGWLGLKAAVLQATGEIAEAIGSVFGGDLEWIGQQLQDDAAATALAMNDKLAEGWDTSKVDGYIRSLREKWAKGMDKPLAVTITEDIQDIQETAAGKDNAVKSIQTVMGSFKVEGDVQAKIAQQQVTVLEKIDEGIQDLNEAAQKYPRSFVPDPNQIDLFPPETIGKEFNFWRFFNKNFDPIWLDLMTGYEEFLGAKDHVPFEFEEDDPIGDWVQEQLGADTSKKIISLDEKILDVEEDSLRVNKDILVVLKTKSGVLQ
jgi:hypothetical protein